MYESWGRAFRPSQQARRVFSREDEIPEGLPRGLGRSYGDSCLNEGGFLVDTTPLDRILSFDAENGWLRAEAGTSLSAILTTVVDRGWFLPVSPGTQFVTLAGAIANDIHGKNHHRAGTFGRYVRSFTLARSDGTRKTCSPTENTELFTATIGGLGLTGVILDAEIALKRIPSGWIDIENIRLQSVDDFFEKIPAFDRKYDYTVAWVDCLSTGEGVLTVGNFAEDEDRPSPSFSPKLTLPDRDLPGPINRLTMGMFNFAYGHVPRPARARVGIQPFFYPLDVLGNWNRLYGRRGFFQQQFVVPFGTEEKLASIFREISQSDEVPTLAVFKKFGELPSPGLLSFPRAGWTLAVDYVNRGESTLRFLQHLETLVLAAGGRLYPAKDGTMRGETFRATYPRWPDVQRLRDPAISSSFWRRVT